MGQLIDFCRVKHLNNHIEQYRIALKVIDVHLVVFDKVFKLKNDLNSS